MSKEPLEPIFDLISGIGYKILTSGKAGSDRSIAHDNTIRLLQILDNNLTCALLNRVTSKSLPDLTTKFAGLSFKNPLGLSAGVVKNITATRPLVEGLNLGFITIGTITLDPYPGNTESPVIIAREDQRALINRIKFKNDGLLKAKYRLEKLPHNRDYRFIASIAPSPDTLEKKGSDIEKAVEETLYCVKRLYPFTDGFEVNISSANTSKLWTFEKPDMLEKLLCPIKEHIAFRNQSDHPETSRFLVAKIRPDLKLPAIAQIVGALEKIGVDGITATNSSTDPDLFKRLRTTGPVIPGGISGKPIFEKSLSVAKSVNQLSEGRLPIIFCGGLSSGEDLYRVKTEANAVLAEGYTDFIFSHSLFWANRILREYAYLSNLNS